MKLAIIGAGISGMTAAWLLHRKHDITVFEASTHVGGHTNTVDVVLADGLYAVDTGFIVFNDWTYPNFIKLLEEIKVAFQPTSMSFSVRCEKTRLEYSGSTLNTLFAQRRNLLRPSFYRMLRDILRFNGQAQNILAHDNTHITLNEYLAQEGYSKEFIDHYIIPMGAAIWSANPEIMGTMPIHFFVRFFKHHGLLSLNRRPQWQVIEGGSRNYAERLTAPFRERIRLSCPVAVIKRCATHVEVKTHDGHYEHFDEVIVATHSDQALKLLAVPTAQEQQILGAIPYQENDALLHTDIGLLPRRSSAWAAWNYHIPQQSKAQVAVTYNMNILQNLVAPETLCVTLNHAEIVNPERVLYRTRYHHPVFTPDSISAQARWRDINGVNRTWYCGAYWGYGFHEDGVNSALRVCQHLLETRAAA